MPPSSVGDAGGRPHLNICLYMFKEATTHTPPAPPTLDLKYLKNKNNNNK